MKEDKDKDMLRHIAMANKLAEFSEGHCRADIKLRPITSQLEKVLYHNCRRSSGNPRHDRYASYIFRYLVPYDDYCDWVAKVNYVGLMGKDALPTNLRRAIRMYIDHRFPMLSCDSWREIRDVINEILRVKRRPEFFREYDERTNVPLWQSCVTGTEAYWDNCHYASMKISKHFVHIALLTYWRML